MEVKMSIKRQKNGVIRVEYRLVGSNTAPGKGRILGRIYFEKSTIDYRFVRFSVRSIIYGDMIETLLEEEEDIYISSRNATNPATNYLREMVQLFRDIGYCINKEYPPQKIHTL